MSSTTAFSSSPFGRVDGAFFVACSLLASGAISAGEAGARVGSCFRATAVAEERIVVERRSEERGAREVSQKERKRATDVSRERERRAESSERRGFRTTFPPPFPLPLAGQKQERKRARAPNCGTTTLLLAPEAAAAALQRLCGARGACSASPPTESTRAGSSSSCRSSSELRSARCSRGTSQVRSFSFDQIQ